MDSNNNCYRPMEYIQLGRTELKVSRICLGCMTYGVPERGTHSWTLTEEESRPLIKKALELGINFFDTANSYSDGTSEEIVGRALRDYATREEVVIATKVYFPTGGRPETRGLSRKSIMTEIDRSLKRLGTDYVDLYQIHRWDEKTPVEETIEALHELIKAGKVRHIGASSMYAWQFSKAQYVAQINGWTPFVSMQNHYNLLYREEEREMIPLCLDQGVAIIPWSPLARGRLTRPPGETTRRLVTDEMGKKLYNATEDSDHEIIEQVGRIAHQRGVSQAQVALAWMFEKPFITAPIVGASRAQHLDDAVAALSLKLSKDEIVSVERPYVPHRVVGF